MPKITDLTAETTVAPTAVVPIVDVATNTSKKTTITTLAASTAFTSTYGALVSPTFTGTVTVPTPAVSGAAANKSYVDGLFSPGEVYIGTTAPATPHNVELWYDTDAVSDTSTGIVGVASSTGAVSCPINVLTYVTNTISVKLSVGKRYRLSWCFRAVGRTDAADTPVNVNLILYDNVTSLQSWVDHWHQFRGNWSNLTGWVLVAGDGITRQLRLGINMGNTSALTLYPTTFMIEDLGI